MLLRGLILKVVAIVLSYLGLGIISKDYFLWKYIIIAIGVILTIIIISEIRYYVQNKKICINTNDPKFEKKIEAYMHKWLSNAGQVAILSHDMTWASNSRKLKSLLNEKARNKELRILVPKMNTFFKELESEGAKIYAYPELGYIPSQSFTITNFGKDYAKVAIGRCYDKKQHVIEEFSRGAHPAFAVANDLVAIIEKSKSLSK